MLKGFVRKIKPLEVLSEEQVNLLHQGALTVLSETGIKILNQKALKLLSENDCQVDFDKKLVKMPASLIEECLSRAPSSFFVKARQSKHDVVIGADRLYFRLFAGMNSIDLDTWEPRTPKRQELYDYMTIVDALPNLHMVGGYPYFGFEGLNENMKIPEETAAKIRNTSKIPIQCFIGGSHFYTAKMMKVVGSEAIGVCHCAAPLTYYEDSIEAMFTWIDAGFPLYLCSGSVAGGSSPATIAGSSVTNNAELIAGVVIAQLKKPGLRTWVGNFVFPQNMVNGTPLFGDICAALHAAAFSQVWRNYKIPTAVSTTGLTSSKIMDYQCGYEKSMHALISALSGVNVIDFHGGLSSELTAHPIQAILDDDVAGMIGRFIEGAEVTDDTIATDLIKEVGPIPGHYLSKEHTRRWWKSQQYTTSVADRLTYPEWIRGGKKSAFDYAKAKYNELLKSHTPVFLTSEQDRKIEEILDELRKHYKVK